MKIKIIDFGLPENHRPLRSHANDAGADVYMPFDCTLEPGGVAKIPLGFGLEVPDGYAAYVFPRSSLAAKGVVCELPPVDSGYRGEIHAIVSNVGNEARTLPKDSRIGQLTVDEIQDILGISRPTAYNLVKKGLFHSVRVGGHIRISKKSFDEWLDQKS